MRFIIQENSEKVGRWTASYIAKAINHHNASSDRPFVLGLPTGSTPLPTYARLIEMCRRGEVSFRNVVTFNMDEYVGLPEDHPQSYHRFMWDNFFSHIDIRPENVNILNGNAPDPEAECEAYEQRMNELGGIDLFLGGVGNDGHIAFNEPFSSFRSRTRIKSLAWDTIVANSRFFDNNTDLVPRLALTVGVDTILDARELIILATGHSKADAVQRAVEGPLTHLHTITALQLHRHGILVCDDDAATEIKVSTYRYFKDREAPELL